MIVFQSDTRRQALITTSTPFQLCHKGLEKDTPKSALSSWRTEMHDDTWTLTVNVSTLRIVDAPYSWAHLNTFLEGREISPIRCTLRTPWNEASERTKRQQVHKARQAVSAVLGEKAPEEPGQLWHALSKSQVTQLLFSADAESGSGTTDETLLQLAIRTQINGILVYRYSPSWPIKLVLQRFKSGYQG